MRSPCAGVKRNTSAVQSLRGRQAEVRTDHSLRKLRRAAAAAHHADEDRSQRISRSNAVGSCLGGSARNHRRPGRRCGDRRTYASVAALAAGNESAGDDRQRLGGEDGKAGSAGDVAACTGCAASGGAVAARAISQCRRRNGGQANLSFTRCARPGRRRYSYDRGDMFRGGARFAPRWREAGNDIRPSPHAKWRMRRRQIIVTQLAIKRAVRQTRRPTPVDGRLS